MCRERLAEEEIGGRGGDPGSEEVAPSACVSPRHRATRTRVEPSGSVAPASAQPQTRRGQWQRSEPRRLWDAQRILGATEAAPERRHGMSQRSGEPQSPQGLGAPQLLPLCARHALRPAFRDSLRSADSLSNLRRFTRITTRGGLSRSTPYPAGRGNRAPYSTPWLPLLPR